MTTVVCPGCGLEHEDHRLSPPAERNATGECFEEYALLLDRSYGHGDFRPVHQLVVDAYICQHPLAVTRREIQSVALCLMTLCLFCEGGEDPTDGPWLHAMMMRERPSFFRALDPPDLTGLVTHRDVLRATTAAEHAALTRDWGRTVWSAWRPHHDRVREWNARTVADVVGRGGRPRR